MPIPPDSRAVWVADSLEQNGIPMQIQQLTSPSGVEDVLAFYRNRWSAPVEQGAPGFVEKRVAGWHIISRLEAGRQTVVQLRGAPDGGSEGFISIADVRATPGFNRATRRFPRRSGSQILSSTVSHDGPGKTTTILLSNGHSVKSNVEFYRDAMVRGGWTLIHGMQAGSTVTLFFNKRDGRCEISISAARGRTFIMANLKEG